MCSQVVPMRMNGPLEAKFSDLETIMSKLRPYVTGFPTGEQRTTIEKYLDDLNNAFNNFEDAVDGLSS